MVQDVPDIFPSLSVFVVWHLWHGGSIVWCWVVVFFSEDFADAIAEVAVLLFFEWYALQKVDGCLRAAEEEAALSLIH
ncbi:MAG: hypothetical protein N3A54_07485, partial [Patescibacteria group bacterium]|nr:hypothetical protein [Patescibacteria group bacterium]